MVFINHPRVLHPPVHSFLGVSPRARQSDTPPQPPMGEAPQTGKMQLLPGVLRAASPASYLVILTRWTMNCIHFQFTDGKMREDGHPGTPREHTWGCCSGYREMLLCSLSLVHPTGAAHPTPMQSRNDTDRVQWECQCSSHQQHIETREGICVWSCVTLLSEMHFPSPHSGNRKSGTCWHIRTMGKNLGNSTEMLLKSKGKADTVLRQGD